MVMAAGTLLSQAVVKYQLTPMLGRAFLRALLWCETKGISLKCCCLASQACVWALLVGRDCSTSTKCCCYFCLSIMTDALWGRKKVFTLVCQDLVYAVPPFRYPLPFCMNPYVSLWAM